MASKNHQKPSPRSVGKIRAGKTQEGTRILKYDQNGSQEGAPTSRDSVAVGMVEVAVGLVAIVEVVEGGRSFEYQFLRIGLQDFKICDRRALSLGGH